MTKSKGVNVTRDGHCSVNGCTKQILARRLCQTHYKRVKVHGDPHTILTNHNLSDEQRFWMNVEKTPTCWVWTGAATSRNYGALRVSGRQTRVHRYSYELHVGPIPDDKFIDHICHNTLCVNPAHLRIASRKQNSENHGRLNSRNTSGFRGVSRAGSRWAASVSHRGVRYNLGTFATPEEAGEVARQKRNELYTYNILDRRAS